MTNLTKQTIQNFLNFKENINSIFSQIETLLNDPKIIKESKTDLVITRNNVTKIFELLAQKKISSQQVLDWAWYATQLCSAKLINCQENIFQVISELERMPENENINNDTIEYFLKQLWPMGDYKLLI